MADSVTIEHEISCPHNSKTNYLNETVKLVDPRSGPSGQIVQPKSAHTHEEVPRSVERLEKTTLRPKREVGPKS